MKKPTAALLLLALFSSSAAAGGPFEGSTVIMACYDKLSGNKFMYNLKTYREYGKDDLGVMFYTVVDSIGVKHNLSPYMTQSYLKCKELKR